MPPNWIETLDLHGRIERHPYQTMLMAVGVGYVLGGGLFTPLTSNTLRAAVQLGRVPAVQRGLLAFAGAALTGNSNTSL